MTETLVSRLESWCATDLPAVVDRRSSWTYATLAARSRRIAAHLLDGAPDLGDARVAFFIPPGLDYVAVLLGIWRAGGIAVPLAIAHPPAELAFVIEDCGASIVISTPETAHIVASAAAVSPSPRSFFVVRDGKLKLLSRTSSTAQHARERSESAARRAMILYTSGTTGKPKGVVTTHGNIAAQIQSLVSAWDWRAEDRTLLVLPLHHVHGIINVLGCALWSGATCETFPRFDAESVWERLSSGEISVFTAVPTIYYRLIASWDAASEDERRRRSEGVRAIRLMMSGSAALPLRTLERWREISSHVLLERYGMTEIGMALANPLRGVRRPGFVGQPLPGVDVRLAGENGDPVPAGTPGELEIRGAGVFGEYWRRPDATREAFRDGWFRTGDVAVVEDGAYRLLGRTSIDIIKSGGHKISALEIEDVLREHPAIAECAVVGVEDDEWGQRVCVAVELRPAEQLTMADLEPWARARLAPYKIPREVVAVPALPRNAMGKVVKPDVAVLFQSKVSGPGEGQRAEGKGKGKGERAKGRSLPPP
ncbi:MAG TPA: acyl-CoA synthetase [Vicinamibacterales bacterium]|nr:acyl-CoA synthetase [Vicinamibacterales bacterium]